MMRNIRNYPVRQAIRWSIVVRKDTYLSRQTLIFWKSFNRTLLQDDNNDKKYKKWSGQLSNSMIDGRQTLIFSNRHLSHRNSFNQTLLQDDNNDEKYKKWSGQASNSMIDGVQTDTYLFEILSTRLFYPRREYGEKDTKRGLFGAVWVVECGFVIDKSTICGVLASCVIRIRRED